MRERGRESGGGETAMEVKDDKEKERERKTREYGACVCVLALQIEGLE